MRERDILFETENSQFWVSGDRAGFFHVWQNGATCATSNFAAIDLSVAIMIASERAGQPMRAREAVHHASECKRAGAAA